MARQSPLIERLAEIEPTLLGYGPAELAIPVIESFGELEFEYAALRRSAALIDQPQRGTIELLGRDAIDFLNRMFTQKLSGLAPGASRCSFWLNRQGRIVADVRVLLLDDLVLLDVDAHVVASVVESLGSYLFAEDVELLDATDRWHRLGLHGPDAPRLLEVAGGTPPPKPDSCCKMDLAGSTVIVDRWDRAGEPGFELSLHTDDALTVWHALHDAAEKADIRLRPIGWHAFNIARIEAGTPQFMLDFGPDSLPAETTLVDSRISMTKGCYLGQEIVARMHNLGHPKQRLVALRFDEPKTLGDFQPVTGVEVLSPHEPHEAVGAVTSSTISPMLGGEPVCFAMMRWSHAKAGTSVAIRTGSGLIGATVQERLRFWPRTEQASQSE